MGLHDDIEETRKAAMPQATQLKQFRQYARGRQRGTLNAAQSRILRSLLGNLFCDNICAMVLQQLSNRVLLARYEVISDGNRTAAQAIETYLRTLWTLNHMPALSAAVHWSMLRDGAHAVGLGWNDDRVTLAREKWWNGRDGVFIVYGDYDQPLYAVKEWKDGQSLRRTVWYDDRIERYIQQDLGWRMFNLPTDLVQGGQPVPWIDRAGQPLGIPLVGFMNVQTPNDADGDKNDQGDARYGMSELDGGLLGLQDEINDIHRDISAAARFAGYQMLYATGVTPATDDDGNEVPLRVEPGAVFQDQNADAKFGVLPPGSLAELERTLAVKLQAVSRKSSVPMHLIGGEWPSGDALLRAERPLTDKAEATARFVGPAWASVAHKATQIANTFGNTGLDTALLITSVFMPAESRDPLTQAEIANARAGHVSQREVLRLYGYSPAEIEQIMQERKQEQEQLGPMERVNLERAQQALSRDGSASDSIRERLASGGQGGAQ